MAINAKDRCGVEVGEPPGYWHFHRCTRSASFVVVTKEGVEVGVCGIHKRSHDRHPLSIQHMVKEVRGG